MLFNTGLVSFLLPQVILLSVSCLSLLSFSLSSIFPQDLLWIIPNNCLSHTQTVKLTLNSVLLSFVMNNQISFAFRFCSFPLLWMPKIILNLFKKGNILANILFQVVKHGCILKDRFPPPPSQLRNTKSQVSSDFFPLATYILSVKCYRQLMILVGERIPRTRDKWFCFN